MLNRFLPILILNFVAVSGQAAEVCETLPDCLQLKTQVSASLAAVDVRIKALEPVLQFSDVVRNADGSIRLFYQSSTVAKHLGIPLPKDELGAEEYCASQGMRLPTIRELAQLASRECTPELENKEPCGAEGISEVAKVGYEVVKGVNVGGEADEFYYKSSGYNREQGDLKYWLLWSSTVDWLHTFRALAFEGQYKGVVKGGFRDTRYTDIAVRCVREM